LTPTNVLPYVLVVSTHGKKEVHILKSQDWVSSVSLRDVDGVLHELEMNFSSTMRSIPHQQTPAIPGLLKSSPLGIGIRW
jgi:PIN domain nuclease of toxin-antitoxin system